MVGNSIDHCTGNEGKMQLYLGTANDMGSFFIAPETDIEGLKLGDDLLNNWKYSALPWGGVADDGISIYNRNK
jgi:hypothetical protein